MIYQLISPEKKEYAQAKTQLHLLQEYQKEFGDDFLDIQEVIEITDEQAKKIMLTNNEYDENDPDDSPEFSLFDAVVGDDFCIVGSTEWN